MIKNDNGSYTFWLTNFGFIAQGRSAHSLEEARAIVKEIGFECGVYDQNENLVAVWSPITGWQDYVSSSQDDA